MTRPRSELQIHTVEESAPGAAVCVVRCVGGVARVGQEFSVPAASGPVEECLPVMLEGIRRYENVHVTFFGPPHAAKVRLSGPGVRGLRPRLVISCG
ncbi:hypothetical protein [Streptomyces sp. NPDC055287]